MEPQQNLTLEDSLKQVLQTLPPVIRTYITQEKYTAAAQNLMRQYKLRIDQGGVLERELLLLLMGVETPQEFVDTLVTEANLDKATVDNITRDINNQIFVPLRAEEMKTSAAAPKPPAAAVPPRPLAPGTHFQLQNKIPTPQRPAAVPRPAMPAGAPRQALPQMPFDHMLEDHEEPHIDFKPQSAPAPRPAMPAMPQAARPAPPPPNLPGQVPPRPVSSAPLAASAAPKIIAPGARAAGPVPPTVAPAPTAPKPPAPPAGLKFSTPPMPSGAKYSVDPYREPIDEEGK